MTGTDLLLVPGEAAARLLIFEVPAARVLTRRQNAGEECAWCDQAGALVPLGGRDGWRPHGCPPCRDARLAYLHAYLAWQHHVRACEDCRPELCSAGRTWSLPTWLHHARTCDTCRACDTCWEGRSLAAAHEAAYHATWKAEDIVCACGCSLPFRAYRLRPYAGHGLGNLRYSHIGPCARR